MVREREVRTWGHAREPRARAFENTAPGRAEDDTRGSRAEIGWIKVSEVELIAVRVTKELSRNRIFKSKYQQ